LKLGNQLAFSVSESTVLNSCRWSGAFLTTKGPIASTSMRVRWKQSIASSGVQTICLFSLKLVFRITGMSTLPNS
jgi:hypothetical protein